MPTAAGGRVLTKLVLCPAAAALAGLSLWIAVRRPPSPPPRSRASPCGGWRARRAPDAVALGAGLVVAAVACAVAHRDHMTWVLHAAWSLAVVGAAVLAYRPARGRGPADVGERGAR